MFNQFTIKTDFQMTEDTHTADGRIFLVAGEISGDLHGANLIRALRELRPGLSFLGAGGDRMEELCREPFLNWTDEAVVGLWDVLKKYPYFKGQFQKMLRQIEEMHPAAVVLIDYPGFNLRLARAIKQKNPRQKIIFFISPQVWAWNRRRIPRMAKILDLMICIFPFEVELYERSGLKTVFVGHPLLEDLDRDRDKRLERDPDLIGLFPGSRMREVTRIAPAMIAAAERLSVESEGEVRFVLAAARKDHVPVLESLLAESGLGERAEIRLGEAHQLMQRCGVGMMASGTATLEAAAFGMPYVIVYKVAWLTWLVGKMLVKVDHLGIVNIITGQEIVPEFLQDQADPTAIAGAVKNLREDPANRDRMLTELAAVIETLDRGDAARRAAEAIAQELPVEETQA